MPPLILLPKKLIFLAYIFCFAAIGVSGVVIVQKSLIWSAVAIFLSAIGTAFFSYHLLPGRYQFKFTEEGIEITAFGRAKIIHWSEVNRIRVGWNAADDAWLSFNKRLFVFYRAGWRDQSVTIWPLYFGLSASKLVALMLPYLKDYPALAGPIRVDDKDGAIV